MLQPPLGIITVTFRATSVPAGMVGIDQMVAVVAREKMAAHSRGAALENILKSAAVTSGHRRTELLQIFSAVTAQNVRNFQHDYPL
jgi:hypothetical protein